MVSVLSMGSLTCTSKRHARDPSLADQNVQEVMMNMLNNNVLITMNKQHLCSRDDHCSIDALEELLSGPCIAVFASIMGCLVGSLWSLPTETCVGPLHYHVLPVQYWYMISALPVYYRCITRRTNSMQYQCKTKCIPTTLSLHGICTIGAGAVHSSPRGVTTEQYQMFGDVWQCMTQQLRMK